MKNKIYNIDSRKEIINTPFNVKQLKEVIEANALDLFGIKIIVNNYYYEEDNIDYIEALGVDENYQLVIFEYRIGKMTRTIRKGLMQIDYIKKHGSQFKMLCNERVGIDNSRSINFNPRLIVFGDHFHKYDYESIKALPYNVELYEVSFFENNVLINKTYVSHQTDLQGLSISIEGIDKDLFLELRNYIFALGEEVVEYGMKNVISYRRVFNFVYVYFADGIHLCVQEKDILIDSYNTLDRCKKMIEEEYDKN